MDNGTVIEIKSSNAEHLNNKLTLTDTKQSKDDFSLKEGLSKLSKNK